MRSRRDQNLYTPENGLLGENPPLLTVRIFLERTSSVNGTFGQLSPTSWSLESLDEVDPLSYTGSRPGGKVRQHEMLISLPPLAIVALLGIYVPLHPRLLGDDDSSISTDILCTVTYVGKSAKSGRIPITIWVNNRGNRRLDLSVIPSLELKPDSGMWYWAPFDLRNTQNSIAANVRSSLNLAPAARLRKEIDLKRLLWDSGNSSIWPSHPLAFVPAGSYLLTFTIEITKINGQEVRNRVSSKPARITIP
jgi:hypothetical protein